MPSILILVSSMATREVLADMIAMRPADGDTEVHAEAAGGIEVARRVAAGERVDIVVLAKNAIDRLIADAKLETGSRVDIVQSSIAIAVRAAATRPVIDTEESVRRAVLTSRSIGYSTGPSGVYLESMFARWGILEEIRARVVVPPPGTPVAALLANGAVELGFQQLSELLNVPGIDVVGPLPAAIQSVTIFSGAVSIACRDRQAARRLLEFMASQAVVAVKLRHGMRPA